jgi:hypothetical protein
MHSVSLAVPPAELATQLTASRFPAQRSESAGRDRSLVGSIRIHRVSVQHLIVNIAFKKIWHVPRLFHLRLNESRKRSGLCVIQSPVGARPSGGQ